MKFIICLFALFFAVPPALAVAVMQAPVFLSAIQDVPLPPGAQEMTDQTAVFDKPEGRIVESVAMLTGTSREEVLGFYKNTLPQLGWRAAGDQEFSRGAERLALSFQSTQGQDFVRFALSPGK